MERATVVAEPRQAARAAARAVRQATIAARTVVEVMDGELFGEAPPGLRSKQDKPDTANGWNSVRDFAAGGVPLKVFLHQRHYGGAFRQVLDATSARRGDLIEDVRWTPLVGQFGGFAKLGSGSCQAANFAVSSPPAPIAA